MDQERVTKWDKRRLMRQSLKSTQKKGGTDLDDSDDKHLMDWDELTAPLEDFDEWGFFAGAFSHFSDSQV